MKRSECILNTPVVWTGSVRFNARKLKYATGVIVGEPQQREPKSNKYYCPVQTADGIEKVLITRLKIDTARLTA